MTKKKKDEPVDNYKIKALVSYIERIRAVQRSFRRYVIQDQTRQGYALDRYVIKVAFDGEVTVREARGGDVPDGLTPTDGEQEAIKAGVATAVAMKKWPKSLPASNAQLDDLRALLQKMKPGDKPLLFVYRNPDGTIPFAQQRIINEEDGKKSDLPWTYWSDGHWRCMEPDGELPLFGLDRLKDADVVFVHEGAKTAARVQWMTDTLINPTLPLTAEQQKIADACPWLRALSGAAHVGWPGGAPNPHRVDWSPLRALNPDVRVVIVCDHDRPGEDAVRSISRVILRRLWMVRFGNPFPEKFDLADAFPEVLFEKRGEQRVYAGPTLDACTEPATWATRDKHELRSEFVEDWQYTLKPSVFVNRVTCRQYDETQFNHMIAPFAHVRDVAALLRTHPSAQAEALAYEPGHPTGRISLDRAQVINVYQPSPIRPLADFKPEDVKPFEDYLEYLIPEETDRANTKRWIATLIARPAIRMHYSLLLISVTQGVGKTTLAEKILVPLVGAPNCSFPRPKDAVESAFTSWLAFKRLAVIGEIYDGHSAKAYNQMKQVITDDWVTVNEKYEKAYKIRNYIHLVASSNSMRALKLDEQDRRWFIPGITNRKRGEAFWTEFNEWLQAGRALPAIAAWAHAYVKKHGPVPPSQHAPMSKAKNRAIEEARSDGEHLIALLGQELEELGAFTFRDGAIVNHGERVVLRLDKIRTWLAERKAVLNQREYGDTGQRFLEKNDKISAILSGYELSLPGVQFKVKGARFRIVTNFPLREDVKWEDLQEWHKTVEEARKMYKAMEERREAERREAGPPEPAL
jgi:hypothetical protein